MPGSDRFKHVHDLRSRLESLGWWHSFELPDGTRIDGAVSLSNLKLRVAQFPVPEDLRGKRVLDIGAWDGWFSFEMERRGTEVLAIDVFDNPRFRQMHAVLDSGVDYKVMNVYDLDPRRLGRFDIVLFLGVLYHLKHPLLALERVCAVTEELAAVDSFVLKKRRRRTSMIPARPVMEFYETDEFGGQTDNWVGPSLPCLLAFCRTAGFARVELQNVLSTTAAVACFRRWNQETNGGESAPHLVSAFHNTNYGINFSSHTDDYVTAWFQSERDGLTRRDVQPEVSGFGTPPIHVGPQSDSTWQATFKLPPGLTSGWHPVRVRVRNGPVSDSLPVAVDVPLPDQVVSITRVADGHTREPNQLELSRGSTLCLWVNGLPDNADRANVGAILESRPLSVIHVEAASPEKALRQVNVEVPVGVPPERSSLRILLGSQESNTVEVNIRG